MLEAMVQPETQPLVVARAVSELLAAFRVAPEALAEAKKFVRRRRVARRKALDAKGYEYVVERLLRPIITMNAAKQLGLRDGTDVRQHVYSSHYHTTDDDDRNYKRLWASFKCKWPQVDTYDLLGKMRRADLFVGLQDKMLVSLEFKYVPPSHVLAVYPSTKQVRQYLTRHNACVLVIYAGMPVSQRLAESCRRAAAELVDDPRAFVVGPIIGPAVEFP